MEGLVRRAFIETLVFSEAKVPLRNVSRLHVHTNFDYGLVGLESIDGRTQLTFAHKDQRRQIIGDRSAFSVADISDHAPSRSAVKDQELPISTNEAAPELQGPSWYQSHIQGAHVAPNFHFTVSHN